MRRFAPSPEQLNTRHAPLEYRILNVEGSVRISMIPAEGWKTSIFDIRYSIFDIRYSTFNIRNSQISIANLICPKSKTLEYRMLNIQYS